MKTKLKINIPFTPLNFETEADVERLDDDTISVNNIDAIKHEGKFLIFDNVHVHATLEMEGLLYDVKNCSIKKHYEDGEWGYRTDAILTLVNRRGAARVPVCENVVLQKGRNKSCTDAVTHDVSLSGMGLRVKSEAAAMLRVGEKCSISIMHGERVIKTEGTIVRMQPVEEVNKVHIGLEVRSTPAYNMFVMEIQRRCLQKSRRES